MKQLLIIGAGGFAVEVEEQARLLGYGDIAFLDDNLDHGGKNFLKVRFEWYDNA